MKNKITIYIKIKTFALLLCLTLNLSFTESDKNSVDYNLNGFWEMKTQDTGLTGGVLFLEDKYLFTYKYFGSQRKNITPKIYDITPSLLNFTYQIVNDSIIAGDEFIYNWRLHSIKKGYICIINNYGEKHKYIRSKDQHSPLYIEQLDTTIYYQN